MISCHLFFSLQIDLGSSHTVYFVTFYFRRDNQWFDRNIHIEVRVGNIDAWVNVIGNSVAGDLGVMAGTETFVDVSGRSVSVVV